MLLYFIPSLFKPLGSLLAFSLKTSVRPPKRASRGLRGGNYVRNTSHVVTVCERTFESAFPHFHNIVSGLFQLFGTFTCIIKQVTHFFFSNRVDTVFSETFRTTMPETTVELVHSLRNRVETINFCSKNELFTTV